MYSFKNDYSEGAHPKILEALINTNLIQEDGYGLDTYTKNATKKIKEEVQVDCDIHLISGGTQTNLLLIGSVLRPHEAVISAESGHIAVHETGAIEHTGHKVITIPSKDGKLTKEMIQPQITLHGDEHMVKPKMVYISNPTEIGTVYSKEELEVLYKYCQENNLYLYADGARLGTALAVKDANLTLNIMAKNTDAFFIGGTKNGALLGEALILKNKNFKEDFRYMIKQKGALLAKGRLLGIQFDTLFTDNLLINLATHANNLADKLRKGIRDLGYDFLIDSPTNQIFPIFPNKTIDQLQINFPFYVWQPMTDYTSAIRLVTSWATKEDAVDAFLEELKSYTK